MEKTDLTQYAYSKVSVSCNSAIVIVIFREKREFVACLVLVLIIDLCGHNFNTNVWPHNAIAENVSTFITIHTCVLWNPENLF